MRKPWAWWNLLHCMFRAELEAYCLICFVLWMLVLRLLVILRRLLEGSGEGPEVHNLGQGRRPWRSYPTTASCHALIPGPLWCEKPPPHASITIYWADMIQQNPLKPWAKIFPSLTCLILLPQLSGTSRIKQSCFRRRLGSCQYRLRRRRRTLLCTTPYVYLLTSEDVRAALLAARSSQHLRCTEPLTPLTPVSGALSLTWPWPLFLWASTSMAPLLRRWPMSLSKVRKASTFSPSLRVNNLEGQLFLFCR